MRELSGEPSLLAPPIAAAPEGSPTPESASIWRPPGGRMRLSARLAIGFLALEAAVAILAPVLAPHAPNAQNLRLRFQSPSAANLLGTDELGRDVFSRLLYAGRVSLIAALLAVGVAVALGVVPGLLAGFKRGWPDAILSRASDAVMSVPGLVLAVGILAVTGPGLGNAMFAVGLVFSPRLFRLVRVVARDVSVESFITAARSMGAGDVRLMARHVAPHTVAPLVVQLSIFLGEALLAEAGLSFLGLGATPPASSWGSMLGSAVSSMGRAPHLVVFPGLVLTATVMCFMTVGEELRRLWIGGDQGDNP